MASSSSWGTPSCSGSSTSDAKITARHDAKGRRALEGRDFGRDVEESDEAQQGDFERFAVRGYLAESGFSAAAVRKEGQVGCERDRDDGGRVHEGDIGRYDSEFAEGVEGEFGDQSDGKKARPKAEG